MRIVAGQKHIRAAEIGDIHIKYNGIWLTDETDRYELVMWILSVNLHNGWFDSDMYFVVAATAAAAAAAVTVECVGRRSSGHKTHKTEPFFSSLSWSTHYTHSTHVRFLLF